jgi:hypothetical protein
VSQEEHFGNDFISTCFLNSSTVSPVGGGLYGPFETRKFALYFEVEWLKANRGL